MDYIPSSEEIENLQDAQRKLRESIQKTEVHFINEPRKGKRLLVLDLDHCLLHFSRTLAEEGRNEELKRPFMDEFLEATYKV
jgi:TFIIF-interacting CTD phosphatase-like protein